jgi:hypothetical protein
LRDAAKHVFGFSRLESEAVPFSPAWQIQEIHRPCWALSVGHEDLGLLSDRLVKFERHDPFGIMYFVVPPGDEVSGITR